MYIIIGTAAFITGIVITAVVFFAVWSAVNTRRQKSRRSTARASTSKPPDETVPNEVQVVKRFKVEFVKIIVFAVLLTYFIGVYIGVKVALIDFSQLGVLLAFIGTPTASTIGFYCWKAKAENILKIKQDNPEETKGIPFDINNIHT